MTEEITNFLGITGKVNIANPLKIDTDYNFTGVISIYGKDRRSNQDGSYNENFKAKFCDQISLIQGDTVILGKDKARKSVKLRQRIYSKGHDYDEIMDFILSTKIDDIIYEFETRVCDQSQEH